MRLVSILALLPLALSAEDLYVAQVDSGAADGSSCANSHSASWFNTSGNWGAGAGKIGAGDTVHLCGTITTTLTVQASGSSGTPITILFESGAKLSQPAARLMNCAKNYIIIDGGSNGIIENTDNGSALGNQISTSGIYASGATNLEVKNLTIRNLYIHTLKSDDGPDISTDGAVYMNGGSNLSVHNCTFSDIGWVLNLPAMQGSGLNIYQNTFSNYDHGVAGIGTLMSIPSGANIYSNHFGTTAVWDTDSNRWHHDGIHIFFGAGGVLSGVNIYDNLFDGDWGSNNTAFIFMEGDFTHANRNAQTNCVFYNNVFIQYPNNVLNNGAFTGSGTNCAFYNNTFLGSGLVGSTALSGIESGITIVNNLFSGWESFVTLNTSSSVALADYNVYANTIVGGNDPWSLNGTAYTTLSAWRTATGGESHSSNIANANVDSSGRPLSGSAAIDSGISEASVFTSDYLGILRPQGSAWDIGAYEFIASAVITGGSVLRNAVLQ